MAPSNRRLSTLAKHLSPTPTVFKSINHIARGTIDIPRLTKFYKDILGFHVIQRPKINLGGAWLRSGQMMVHIIKVDDLEEMNVKKGDPEPTYWQRDRVKQLEAEAAKVMGAKPRQFMAGIGQHLAFQVDNVDEIIAKLKENDIQHFVVDHNRGSAKQEGSRGMLDLGIERQVFFYDPDGNAMECGNYGDEFPDPDLAEDTVVLSRNKSAPGM